MQVGRLSRSRYSRGAEAGGGRERGRLGRCDGRPDGQEQVERAVWGRDRLLIGWVFELIQGRAVHQAATSVSARSWASGDGLSASRSAMRRAARREVGCLIRAGSQAARARWARRYGRTCAGLVEGLEQVVVQEKGFDHGGFSGQDAASGDDGFLGVGGRGVSNWPWRASSAGVMRAGSGFEVRLRSRFREPRSAWGV